jgi:hypothetical protein
MSGGLDGDLNAGRRAQPAVEEKRFASRSSVLGTGTLACHRCDVPIAPAARPLSLTDRVRCPYCATEGPARDFLSLAAPTRPARVVIRVAIEPRYLGKPASSPDAKKRSGLVIRRRA